MSQVHAIVTSGSTYYKNRIEILSWLKQKQVENNASYPYVEMMQDRYEDDGLYYRKFYFISINELTEFSLKFL